MSFIGGCANLSNGAIGMTGSRHEVVWRDDLAIREEVRRLVRDKLLLADAGLRVEGGVVGIQGRAQRRSEAEAIQRLVAQVPGVVSVCGLIEFPGDHPTRSGAAA
jgi:osmotically-inducible protein OsmY